jgi:glucokinase
MAISRVAASVSVSAEAGGTASAARAGHPYLVADVGGTKIELGRASPDGGSIIAVRQLAVADFATIDAAVEAYLADQAEAWPQAIALAIAGPVLGDEVALTNGPWRFSVAASEKRLRVGRLLVLNDFTALALGLPTLAAEHRMKLGGGEGDPAAPIGLIGPGTGLGMSGLVRVGGRWQPLAGEGGHASLAPEDEREAEVLAVLRRHFGHVSAERVLSGPGLVNLFAALCEIDGVPVPRSTPESITAAALADSSPRARAALAMFCSFLGAAAGNLALMLGARGGLFIGGGICPRFSDFLAASACRTRFEAKGRMRPYLESIPLWLITAPHPALHGAAAALRGES